MASSLRISFAGGLYHVTSRGNNREKIFLDEGDVARYRLLLRRYRAKHDFKLYAYTVMPNHVHLLLETTETASISQIMHALNTAYAKYFNAKYDRVGHVFQGRFHSAIVDGEAYFLEVMRYLDLNPVRAGMVKRPADFDASSHAHFARGRPDDLVEPDELYANLGDSAAERQAAYREFVAERQAGGSGLAEPSLTKSLFIGGDDFEARMVRRYGREIWPKYRRLLDRLNALRRSALPE